MRDGQGPFTFDSMHHHIPPHWPLLVALAWPAAAMAAQPLQQLPCLHLDLPVAQVVSPPSAYVEFCQENPGECDLGGPVSELRADAETKMRLDTVNRAVNHEIRFMPDTDCSGEEEHWAYPVHGHGDCEDFALEKRRRLVAIGLPRAAFTMAIVHHRARLFSHAVLLAETDNGTLVLDNMNSDIVCWNRIPFNFEMRERTDGRWTRFDQRTWHWTTPSPAASGTR